MNWKKGEDILQIHSIAVKLLTQLTLKYRLQLLVPALVP